MNLPIDLEDIFGAAVVDTFRRTFLLFSSVVIGSYLGTAAISVGEVLVWYQVTHSLALLDPANLSLEALYLSPLVPFGSAWGLLYGPFLLGAVLYFVKADQPGMRGWSIALSVVGLFRVVSSAEPGWFAGVSLALGPVLNPEQHFWRMMGVGIVVWAGLAGTIIYFGVLLQNRSRRKTEEYFNHLAEENEQRRRENAEGNCPRPSQNDC